MENAWWIGVSLAPHFPVPKNDKLTNDKLTEEEREELFEWLKTQTSVDDQQ